MNRGQHIDKVGMQLQGRGFEEPSTVDHDEMRGMYYRGEIDREVLYQLEHTWVSRGLGARLTAEDFVTAQERAAIEGERYWYWQEHQELPAAELLQLAAARRPVYRFIANLLLQSPDSIEDNSD